MTLTAQQRQDLFTGLGAVRLKIEEVYQRIEGLGYTRKDLREEKFAKLQAELKVLQDEETAIRQATPGPFLPPPMSLTLLILVFLLMVVASTAGTLLALALASAVESYLQRQTSHAGCGCTPAPPATGRAKTRNPKPWSKKFACCLGCVTTAVPHQAHGLCRKCYWRQYTRPPRRKT